PYMGLTANSGSMFLASSFIGPFAIALAAIGFSDATWRARWLVGGGLIAVILLVLGNHTAIAPALFTAVPLLQIVRFPIKLMIFVVLALSIAAARGIHLLSGGGTRKTIAAALMLGLAGLVWAIVAYCQPSVSHVFLSFSDLYPAAPLQEAVRA